MTETAYWESKWRKAAEGHQKWNEENESESNPFQVPENLCVVFSHQLFENCYSGSSGYGKGAHVSAAVFDVAGARCCCCTSFAGRRHRSVRRLCISCERHAVRKGEKRRSTVKTGSIKKLSFNLAAAAGCHWWIAEFLAGILQTQSRAQVQWQRRAHSCPDFII